MFDKLKKGFSGILKKVKIKELSDKELNPIINELIDIMIKNEVAVGTAEALGAALKEELMNIEHSRFKSARPMIEEALTKAVYRILEVPEEDLVDIFAKIKEAKKEERPYVILMLGINGTGKTTTIAKLTQTILDKGYSVVLAAGDTYRAGAIEQLSKHGEKLGVRTIKQEQGSDPAAVAIDAIDHAEAKGVDVVIIDTAGRMQNNINLVRELGKVVRMSDPDLKIFVGDSLAGNDVVRQAAQFNKDIGIDGVIMTKIDSDAKGGGVLSVAHTVGKPILYLGIGQGYKDLQEFEASFIVKQILP
ncbi:MAG: signal recognition particle-docking protein FtsY [Candidatus Heimdallarchaeota archaeon]|nr:signal recognition particle-docking protein FtsY [Candidatus Heimdallarchaeota archaeon]